MDRSAGGVMILTEKPAQYDEDHTAFGESVV
jgi:hypothetical protein